MPEYLDGIALAAEATRPFKVSKLGRLRDLKMGSELTAVVYSALVINDDERFELPKDPTDPTTFEMVYMILIDKAATLLAGAIISATFLAF